MSTQSRALNALSGVGNDPDTDYCTRRYDTWLRNGAKIDNHAVYDVWRKISKTDNSDGSGRIRPSMIGKCVRAQILSYQGAERTPHPLELLEIFNVGNMYHRHWQEVGVSEKWLVDVEVPVSIPTYGVHGSADGICDDGSIFELKTINGHMFQDLEAKGPMSSHVNQVQLYMHALDARRASIVYVNKASAKTLEFRVSYNPEHVSKVLIPMIQEVAEPLERINEGRETSLPIVSTEYELCRKQTGKKYTSCEYRLVCAPELSE